MKFTIGSKSYDGTRPLVMGVLNITPDSFYSGSRYFEKERAVEKGIHMAGAGADILDIGGESSRPGAAQVTEDEELDRVIPVIESLTAHIAIPVSIDTCRSHVAAEAVKAGATIVNDISALRFDQEMAGVVESSGASVVLMHMQGTPRTMQKNPRYDDVVEDIIGFLKDRVDFAVGRGIPKEKIIVDPGIGFGKTLDHNLTILNNAGRFHETGCAVLIGASRKSMIGAVTGAPAEERIWGTAAITACCVLGNVEIHRVHDVGAMRQVCDVAAAIRSESWN